MTLIYLQAREVQSKIELDARDTDWGVRRELCEYLIDSLSSQTFYKYEYRYTGPRYHQIRDRRDTQDSRGQGFVGNNYSLQGAYLSQWRATTLKRMIQCLKICTLICDNLQEYISNRDPGLQDIGMRRSIYLQDIFSEAARRIAVNIVGFLDVIRTEPASDRAYDELTYIQNIKDSELLVVTALHEYIRKKGGIGVLEIRVRDESAFTYVLNALNDYWTLNNNDSISPVLTCFFQSLVDRRFVKPIPTKKIELDRYKGSDIDTSSERIRIKLRDVIWWISLSKHIRPWIMSREDDEEYHRRAIDNGFVRQLNSAIRIVN